MSVSNDESVQLGFLFLLNRQFVETCQEALDLNRSMITPEQWDYHEVLKNSFEDLVRRLNDILKEPVSSALVNLYAISSGIIVCNSICTDTATNVISVEFVR